MQGLPFFVLLFLLGLPKMANGCNNRVIVLKPKWDGKGNWVLTKEKCRTCKDGQEDTGTGGTPPPGTGGTPTTSETTTPTPNTTTTTWVTPVPIGDCECGQGIKWERIASSKGLQLNRPWMVHFRIQLENKEYIACSGSLINRRWVISAAHCFCALNEHVQCTLVNRGFKKKLLKDDMIYGKNINERINVTFGSTHEAQSRTAEKEIKIAEVIIHPDYWSDKTKHGNPYDLALIQMDKDVYSGRALVENGVTLVHPICLPPFGPVDWRMTRDGSAILQHYLYTNQSEAGKYSWLRPDKPRIPFEDMDCKLRFKPDIGIPNGIGAIPRTPALHADIGFLKCHPDQFAHDPYTKINIDGRNSFITGFGSIAHPLSLNGLAPWGDKRVCRASPYSPTAGGQPPFRRCKTNKCNKVLDNPSLLSDKCKGYRTSGLRERDLGNASNTIVARLRSSGRGPRPFPNDPAVVDCYPWDSQEAAKVQAFHHRPYKSGWCETVCEDPSNGNSSNGIATNCEVQPNKNWGWCTPGCDGSEDPREPPSFFGNTFARNVHELPVDAFVYENCSTNVDTMTEFCTGTPITRGKMAEYNFNPNRGTDNNTLNANNTFNRTLVHPRMYHPEDEFWNGNSTIIRKGARYQGRQHSSIEGDSCFGDAGGSVWKYHVFRSPASDAEPDPRDAKGKLAVLTGVISRFERQCGAFSPYPSEEVGDEPNLPTQHTVHARVVNFLPWIVPIVFGESSCKIAGVDNTETNPAEGGEPMTDAP